MSGKLFRLKLNLIFWNFEKKHAKFLNFVAIGKFFESFWGNELQDRYFWLFEFFSEIFVVKAKTENDPDWHVSDSDWTVMARFAVFLELLPRA